jgi:hypothetical protein
MHSLISLSNWLVALAECCIVLFALVTMLIQGYVLWRARTQLRNALNGIASSGKMLDRAGQLNRR